MTRCTSILVAWATAAALAFAGYIVITKLGINTLLLLLITALLLSSDGLWRHHR